MTCSGSGFSNEKKCSKQGNGGKRGSGRTKGGIYTSIISLIARGTHGSPKDVLRSAVYVRILNPDVACGQV